MIWAQGQQKFQPWQQNLKGDDNEAQKKRGLNNGYPVLEIDRHNFYLL